MKRETITVTNFLPADCQRVVDAMSRKGREAFMRELNRHLVGQVDGVRITHARRYGLGRWVVTGRHRSRTTVWVWRLSLRWGWLPWPRRYAAGGIVKTVYRWEWPQP